MPVIRKTLENGDKLKAIYTLKGEKLEDLKLLKNLKNVCVSDSDHKKLLKNISEDLYTMFLYKNVDEDFLKTHELANSVYFIKSFLQYQYSGNKKELEELEEKEKEFLQKIEDIKHDYIRLHYRMNTARRYTFPEFALKDLKFKILKPKLKDYEIMANFEDFKRSLLGRSSDWEFLKLAANTNNQKLIKNNTFLGLKELLGVKYSFQRSFLKFSSLLKSLEVLEKTQKNINVIKNEYNYRTLGKVCELTGFTVEEIKTFAFSENIKKDVAKHLEACTIQRKEAIKKALLNL